MFMYSTLLYVCFAGLYVMSESPEWADPRYYACLMISDKCLRGGPMLSVNQICLLFPKIFAGNSVNKEV